MSRDECQRIVAVAWNGGKRDARFRPALQVLGLSVGEFDRLLRAARGTEVRFSKRIGLAPIGSGKRR